jgi:hypothetical protein
LLLAPDKTVLDVDMPAAITLIDAVDQMGTLNNAVPGPLLPVDIVKSNVADLVDCALGYTAKAEIKESQSYCTASRLKKASAGQFSVHEILPSRKPETVK